MEQIAEEVHKQTRKPSKYRKVNVFYPNDIWSADIVEMNSEGTAKQNDDYKYILVVIDIYSRYAWTRALKNKTASETAKAFKSIISDSKHMPVALWVDQGKEFNNKDVKQVLNNVKIYSTYGEGKAVYVERLNRTLKNMMYKIFTVKMNRKWLDILEPITKAYNNRIHSGTNEKPIDIYKKDVIIPVEINDVNKDKPKFKVGDRVRISYKRRPTFDKAYLPNWTWEIFIVNEVNKTNPYTYKLKDHEGEIIKGNFYESELQITKQKENFYLIESILDEKTIKKKKYSLVKWLGYDKPTWEPTSEINEIDIMK
jgi:transposase InsO family protein